MRMTVTGAAAALVVVAGLAVAPSAMAAPETNDRTADVVDHWSPQRLAAAQPRDLVIDERGLGYERDANGRLNPHGHGRAASIPEPTVVPSAERSQPQPTTRAKPVSDTTAPSINSMTPAAGTTIGTTHTFVANVSDASGVRSVTFTLTAPNGRNSSFAATAGSNGDWSLTLQNFTVGNWSWTVKATDNRGNVRTSAKSAFTVSTTASPGTGTVTNSAYTSGGLVQTAAGRIFFEMPDAKATTGWAGYVCSGTVVQDPADNDRSIILTAAHCVFDDVNKVFARNVLFIPDQAYSRTPTDRICSNDHFGCWSPSYGVVDTDWTTREFPDNIPWDYAYYVVPTQGAHQQGTTATTDSLEQAVGALPVQFDAPMANVANAATDRTTALGYSYSDDPNFMYCAEDMGTNGADNWWLPNCGLSGGASGGPWTQPFDPATGSGRVISVNSWGYTTGPGMAGPKLSGTSAQTLFTSSQSGIATSERGSIVD